MLPARIIPARAGFTTGPAGPAEQIRDHPRSRGVYRAPLTPRLRMHGSSPLARGLLRHPSRMGRQWRIIPARAGFTWRCRPRAAGPADHPRSRGVYLCEGRPDRLEDGSSPLARGLRHRPGPDGMRLRIIPARAGFTRRRAPGARPRGDHPRSRGVYEKFVSASGAKGGSSPLARGLHEAALAAEDGIGIIPARAGFTRSSSRPPERREDHPRSRGVYTKRPSPPRTGLGSSPLARGLPAMSCRPSGRPGIIPARAGFTRRRRRRAHRGRDHPRSRGVYER